MSKFLSENWYLSVVNVYARGGLGIELKPAPARPAKPPSALTPPPSKPPSLPAVPPEGIDRKSEEFLVFENGLRKFRRWMSNAEVKAWFVEYQWWVRVSRKYGQGDSLTQLRSGWKMGGGGSRAEDA